MEKVRQFLRTENNRRDLGQSLMVTSGTLLLCTAIGFVFHLLGLSEANIITIYILGVLVISSLTNYWLYGIAASVMAVLLFNCMFADPIFTLMVYDTQYTVTMFLLFIASLITGYIMNRFRQQLVREGKETHRSEVLLQTSQSLQSAKDDEAVYAIAAGQLCKLFDTDILLFPVQDGDIQPPLLQKASADGVTYSQVIKHDTSFLQGWLAADEMFLEHSHSYHKALYCRVQNEKHVFAVAGIMLQADHSLNAYERNLIAAMMDEVGLALQTGELRRQRETAERTAEVERLRATLLRTISHDLRTPLTSIRGNADILLSSHASIAPEQRKTLYQSLYEDSDWLIGLVENLLFVSRLEDGKLNLTFSPEVLQEILEEAISHCGKYNKNHTLRLEMPEDLLLVKADARLLVQVVVNLVDNAFKYTPPGADILVRAHQQDGRAVVEVADTGPGVPAGEKEQIFDMFYTANNKSGDGRRGIGLGLALCKTIVEAHGGNITLRDNEPHGAIFSFGLDTQEVQLG